MEISVNGIEAAVITLKAGDGLQVGDLVVMSGSGTAAKAAENSEPIGVCVSRSGGYAGVQIRGGISVACTDEGLTPGYVPIKVGAGNMVAKGTAGVPRLVISNDTAAKRAELFF